MTQLSADGRLNRAGAGAGGAMASIMLATYPDVSAGGAIIAGISFGAGASVTYWLVYPDISACKWTFLDGTSDPSIRHDAPESCILAV